jgi:hypothetical protein
MFCKLDKLITISYKNLGNVRNGYIGRGNTVSKYNITSITNFCRGEHSHLQIEIDFKENIPYGGGSGFNSEYHDQKEKRKFVTRKRYKDTVDRKIHTIMVQLSEPQRTVEC